MLVGNAAVDALGPALQNEVHRAVDVQRYCVLARQYVRVTGRHDRKGRPICEGGKIRQYLA